MHFPGQELALRVEFGVLNLDELLLDCPMPMALGCLILIGEPSSPADGDFKHGEEDTPAVRMAWIPVIFVRPQWYIPLARIVSTDRPDQCLPTQPR